MAKCKAIFGVESKLLKRGRPSKYSTSLLAYIFYHAIELFVPVRIVARSLSRLFGLSICQTCKYMGVDFLDFLRSGEKDIHAFAESRRGRRRRTQARRAACRTMQSPTLIVSPDQYDIESLT